MPQQAPVKGSASLWEPALAAQVSLVLRWRERRDGRAPAPATPSRRPSPGSPLRGGRGDGSGLGRRLSGDPRLTESPAVSPSPRQWEIPRLLRYRLTDIIAAGAVLAKVAFRR